MEEPRPNEIVFGALNQDGTINFDMLRELEITATVRSIPVEWRGETVMMSKAEHRQWVHSVVNSSIPSPQVMSDAMAQKEFRAAQGSALAAAHGYYPPKPSLLKRFLAWWDPK